MDVEVSRRFLTLLWGGKEEEKGFIEIFSGKYRDGKLEDPRGRHFKTVDGAAKDVERLAPQGREIYVCVGLGGSHPSSGRLQATDVVAACGLWCDLDFAGPNHAGKSYPPGEPEARQILGATGLPPTLIVHSGNGLQAWWLFEEPWYFDTAEEKARFRSLARGWVETLTHHARALGGWDLDQAKDIVRLLRVAGTDNHKGGEPRPVQILEESGARYTDWSRFESAIVPLANRVGAYAGNDAEIKALSHEIQAIIDTGRNTGFPGAKLMALMDNDAKFKKTWQRKRADLGDDSSRYDASLAWYGVRVDCTTEEIVRLITDHRTYHGDDAKGKTCRPDYMARTILWARSCKDKGRGEEQFLSGMPQVEAKAVAKDGREAVVERLRKITGLDSLVGVKKYGKRDSSYHLVLDDGESIEIGGAEDVMNQRLFRKPVFNFSGSVIAKMKDWQWDQVVCLLHQIAELEDVPDSGKVALIHEWLSSYRAGATVHEGEDWSEALVDGEAFLKDERFHFTAAQLKRHVRLTLMERVEDAEFKVMLRMAGCAGARIKPYVKSLKKSVGRYYYSIHLPLMGAEMKTDLLFPENV